VLWGKGITDMVKRVVAITERDQREGRMADTEGVGLEASKLADLMQTGGPKMLEECKHLQPGRQLKSVPMPKPQPNPKPNLDLAPVLRPTPTQTAAPGDTSTPKGATAPVPTSTR
jgi:hypothetical protein